MHLPAIYGRSQVTNYVLFLVGRVGSTYLSSLLDSHPSILAMGEELRDLEEQGAQVQLDWVRGFLTPPVIGTKKARGFNVKLIHICDPETFRSLVIENDSKILHMKRQNRVKAVISRINGRRLYEKTGMWGLFDKKNQLPPLAIDLSQFDEYLKHRERMDVQLEEYVKSLQLPTMDLYYEDLLSDRTAFLNDCFKFLDVPIRGVEGTTLKITSDDLSKAITNFYELRAVYQGTPYYSMFGEEIIP